MEILKELILHNINYRGIKYIRGLKPRTCVATAPQKPCENPLILIHR